MRLSRAVVLSSALIVFGTPSTSLAQTTWRTESGLYGAMIPTAAGTNEEQAARDFLAVHGATLGLAPSDTLVVTRIAHAHGYTLIELARVVHGARVSGAPIVVRMRPDRAIDLAEVTPMPTSRRPWPASVSEPDARAAAIAGVPFVASVLESSVVALVYEDLLVAAVVVELSGRSAHDRARAYVDASTLEILRIESLALDALGRVYAHNPLTDTMTTSDLPLVDLSSTTNLVGTHLRVRSCDQLSARCDTQTSHAVPDLNGDYLFPPMPLAFDDAFAEVSAYHHGSRVVAYFASAHSFNWSCMARTTMDVLVNYSDMPHVAYDNAMFVPGSSSSCGFLAFGQGGLADYAYDGDVVYHEYGHAVTDQISALGFLQSGVVSTYQPLAINEGTSDYWAAAVQGDPQIAESLSSLEGFMGALRSIDNTLACPGDLVGEGHFDGRIWSGFGWNVRGIVGQTRADALWFVTMSSLSGGVTLAQATNTLLATVASEVSMGTITAAEQTRIMAAAQAHGLPDCTMFVPLDDGRAHSGYSGNQFITGTLSRGVAPLEYTIAVPADVTDVEIDVTHPGFNGQVTVHFLSGQPIRASASRVVSSFSVPVGRNGTAAYRVLDGLAPCSTLYVAVQTTDLAAGESLYGILARVNTTHETRNCPGPRFDAGPIDPGTDTGLDAGADASMAAPMSGGCGCRAGAGRAGGPWIVLLALAIAARRRR